MSLDSNIPAPPSSDAQVEVLHFRPLQNCLGAAAAPAAPTTVVEVIGDLDANAVCGFAVALGVAIDEARSAVVVDLSRVDFLAIAGATTLAAAARRARARDLDLFLVPGGRPVRHTLTVTGLLDDVDCFPSSQAAIDRIRAGRATHRAAG